MGSKKMGPYRGIIFDLDGVICSTDRYHYEAWKEIADQFQVPFDENKNDRLRGIGRMESLEIILENYQGELSAEEKEQLANQKNEKYRQLLGKMTPKNLSDEVAASLKELRKNGIPMAIGSSSKNAKYILNQLGLQDFFDAVVDGNEIGRGKPDPEVFLRAAEKLGLKPECCLVVEDAEAGIDAANAGGFACAGLGMAVKNADCTWHLERFGELCGLCGIGEKKTLS